jgi:hypothetical protein
MEEQPNMSSRMRTRLFGKNPLVPANVFNPFFCFKSKGHYLEMFFCDLFD